MFSALACVRTYVRTYVHDTCVYVGCRFFLYFFGSGGSRARAVVLAMLGGVTVTLRVCLGYNL